MNGRTYSIKKIFDKEEKNIESLIITNDNRKGESFNIITDEKFKKNFINAIKKLKLESLYKSEMESWLMIFEKQLFDKKITNNKEYLKRELDKLFNSSTIQEREVRLSNILLKNTNHSFYLSKGLVYILEKNTVIGKLDTKKIM
jgi:hypothetical protein